MEIHMDYKYFNLIQSGEKNREGRCAEDKYTALKPGDAITFVTTASEDKDKEEENGRGNARKLISARVLSTQRYPTFHDMLVKEGLANCLPGITSLPKGVEIYRSFPAYAEKEDTYGVIAIRFTLEIEIAE